MSWAVTAVLSVAVAACSGSGGTAPDAGSGGSDAGKQPPTSQETYTYYGCDDAGTYGCPRDRVFTCALEFIRTKHVHCTDDPDCTLVRLDNPCVDYFGDCYPAAVAVLEKSSFLTETDVEVKRYCDTAQCRESGSCAAVTYEARCVMGACTTVAVVDGGTDAGETDAGSSDGGTESDAGADAGSGDGGP